MKSYIVATVLFTLIFAPAVLFAQTGSPDASSPTKPGSAADTPAPAKPSGADAPTPNKPDGTDAPAQSKPGGADASVPVKPGAVRITTKAPDLDRWDVQRSANGMLRVFKCKALACPDPTTVSFTFLKSPTRNPDPQALDKLAKIDLPKSIRAADAAREVLSDGTQKIETLTSKTATLKNYPAVINETKISQGKVSVYLNTAIIFAGPLMIRVQSTSQNRDFAQKSLNQFVDVMRIEEGPPLQPGTPLPASGGVEQL